jgi:hypothetical protein
MIGEFARDSFRRQGEIRVKINGGSTSAKPRKQDAPAFYPEDCGSTGRRRAAAWANRSRYRRLDGKACDSAGRR